MANQKIIHGVCINLDLIKSIGDLKDANFFSHLPDSSKIEAEAAIELGFKKQKQQEPKQDEGEGAE
jgi:hypothetical protein